MTKDYKNTLNLPVTDFPMKASLSQRESEILKHWQDMELYKVLRQKRQGREKFILADGPPYANGHIHIGHALNKILKDIIVKAKSFSGFDSPFVPGWDCHGLPIELNVEKKLGKVGTGISADQFRQACRDYATGQIDIQREEFKRLGVIGDWDQPYRTMDYSFEANIIRALADIYEKGYVKQGFKPVHWCIDCGSALAEAELEYANKISPAIDVRFRVVNEEDFFARLKIKNVGSGPISVPIWTTTPWSLPANEAVALGPNFNYVLVQVDGPQGKERLLLIEELLATCLQRYGIENFQELARSKGQAFEKLLLQHPFFDRQVPIILGEHVTTDTGTGAISTAPAHGPEDYVVGQKYNLPVDNPIGTDGLFLPKVPFFAGEHVNKVNPHILAVLEEHKNLIHKENVEHSYPHCWRHKTALILLATPQWFINLPTEGHAQNQIVTTALNSIGKIHWLPKWGHSNIAGMIANRPDWCISRQRNWGTPIPIFIHKETRQPHPDTAQVMKKIADHIEKEGMEVWFKSKVQDWLGADAQAYLKINDVLDVWFDSGLVHFCVLKQRSELQFPADVVLEGSDQYRGWFQSMLLTAVAMYAQAPYKTVITHGFTVDEKGRKMSKSLGNVIAPEKIWNSLGADILRLWAAATDYTGEVAISDEILKRLSEAYRRIRNTSRYFLSNLFDFDPKQHLISSDQMLSLDRWAVTRANQLQQQIQKAYDQFNFHEIYQLIHNFCIVDMGGFYLDIIKDRQYTMQKNSLARRSAQTAMFHIAEAMVRWLAPILSFTAEEIWRYLPGERAKSVFLEEWYAHLNASEENLDWNLLMQVRDAVNKEIENCRNEGEVGSSLEAEVELYCQQDSKLAKLLTTLGNELRFVLITSVAKVTLVKHMPTEMAIALIDGNEIAIKITPSANPKCIRCWHRRADVGSDPEHPEICARCVENVVGEGEVRRFV